ncbi:MAG: hypothetical protein MJ134_07920 [Lachnospiraceae bacterium]|nr:hypothetical protein [Lachnospiraceae bacterium]
MRTDIKIRIIAIIVLVLAIIVAGIYYYSKSNTEGSDATENSDTSVKAYTIEGYVREVDLDNRSIFITLENGTIDGSTSKVLESASDGFMKRTASGAVTGATVGAMKYRKNPTGYYFVAGTVLATVLGFMAIDAIMPGDYVLAKDMDTGIVSYEPAL